MGGKGGGPWIHYWIWHGLTFLITWDQMTLLLRSSSRPKVIQQIKKFWPLVRKVSDLQGKHFILARVTKQEDPLCWNVKSTTHWCCQVINCDWVWKLRERLNLPHHPFNTYPTPPYTTLTQPSYPSMIPYSTHLVAHHFSWNQRRFTCLIYSMQSFYANHNLQPCMVV